jgi:hypothetical protein
LSATLVAVRGTNCRPETLIARGGIWDGTIMELNDTNKHSFSAMFKRARTIFFMPNGERLASRWVRDWRQW